MHTASHWIAERAPLAAIRWLDRFQEALETLRDRPERCPIAKESRKVDFVVREFHFGKRPNVFRVLFVIDANFVRVLCIRRAQRLPISPDELQESYFDE
ncbi:MAG: type II toxin-antitoxin system RelE/ParE family toxin [Planctomycetia bacterium]|nr:type II toxin-antitoxin system RelE/ParE family toxin [Planctomycetia bacterium]